MSPATTLDDDDDEAAEVGAIAMAAVEVTVAVGGGATQAHASLHSTHARRHAHADKKAPGKAHTQ